MNLKKFLIIILDWYLNKFYFDDKNSLVTDKLSRRDFYITYIIILKQNRIQQKMGHHVSYDQKTFLNVWVCMYAYVLTSKTQSFLKANRKKLKTKFEFIGSGLSNSL
jgi:hypothetical protein